MIASSCGAQGHPLFVPVDDASKLYLRATAASQKVFWFAI